MYRNRLFVICNVIINRVIIVRANINILNREIESPFSNNPKKKKKKKKNIDETSPVPNLTDLRHFSSQLVVVCKSNSQPKGVETFVSRNNNQMGRWRRGY